MDLDESGWIWMSLDGWIRMGLDGSPPLAAPRGSAARPEVDGSGWMDSLDVSGWVWMDSDGSGWMDLDGSGWIRMDPTKQDG